MAKSNSKSKNTKKRTSKKKVAKEPRSFGRIIAIGLVLAGLVGLVSARLGLGPDSDDETANIAGAQTVDNATETGTDTATTQPPVLTAAPAVLRTAPPLTEVQGWINTDGFSPEGNPLADVADPSTTPNVNFEATGQVYIVQFWTFGCRNCKNTLDAVQSIYNRHHPRGLEIIGVHAPEFDYEKDPTAVAKASAELGVIWPVALDPDKKNFRAWQGDRRFWPRTYVIDQNGLIRFDHIGEGKYEELEATVDYLITNGA